MEFLSDAAEETTNPTTISAVLSQTYARVDKNAGRIELLASDVQDNTESIGALEIESGAISARVSQQQTQIGNLETDVNTELSSLYNEVAAKVTATDVSIQITQAMGEINSVQTTTGFIFNEEGLKIEKDGTDLTTLIDEDGMEVARGGEAVLVADNQGVEALNLTANQYLTIGKNSRFEDYKEVRTGCFFIGEEE